MTTAEEFVEFAEAVYPQLRRTAFLLCGDWHTAEDLAQMALEKVFVSWRKIRQQDAVHAYTHRTLVNSYAIAITPDGKIAYVTSYRSETVTPITTATNTPEQPIHIGGGPWSIAITPDGKTAYVISKTSHTVTPITTATNTPGKPIEVGKTPWSMVITP